MRLIALHLYHAELPYAGGVYRLSGGREFHSFTANIVCAQSDTGLTGWGESTPFGGTYIAAHAGGIRAGIEALAPAVLGQDPRHFDRTYEAMDAVLAGQASAKSAIDIACWDLAGNPGRAGQVPLPHYAQ